MQTSLDHMAKRIENAKADFTQMLIDTAGITIEEARSVCAYYLKHKLAKLEVGIGRISVKHGRLLDPQVIKNAVPISQGRLTGR